MNIINIINRRYCMYTAYGRNLMLRVCMFMLAVQLTSQIHDV